MRQALQPFVPPAAPLPAVFGARGILNPAVVIPTALVLGAMGGAMPVVAIVAILLSLYSLAFPSFRRVTWPTAMVGAVMAGVALILMSLPHDGGAGADKAGYSKVAGIPDVPPPPDPATAAAFDGPPHAGRWEQSLLADIHSLPASRPPEAKLPPADSVLAPGDDADLRELYEVQRRPELKNADMVAQALAASFRARNPVPPTSADVADTVLIWVHIDVNGHVADDGWQVISSSNDMAIDAAAAAVPYLRYLPAEAGGHPVPVWAAQRLIIEK
jgi:hypothetical protein